MKTNSNSNPYNLTRNLLEVWTALGRPALFGDGSLPWCGRAVINEERVAALEPFMQARGQNGKFSKVIIDDLAELMTRGRWIPNSDPLTWLRSGMLAQGNHRLKAVKKAKVALSFSFQLGVANEAEHELGRVFPWKRSDLLQENRRTVAVALLACKNFFGNLKETLGRGYDSDIKLIAEIFRDHMEYTFSLVPENVKRFSRTAITLALMEGAIIDQRVNGSTEVTENFVKGMCAQPNAPCAWGSLFNKFVIDHRAGSVGSQSLEYHSAVLALKRAILGVPYKMSARNKHPDKSSESAEWGNLSAGEILQPELDFVIAERIEQLREANPTFGEGTKVFPAIVRRIRLSLDAPDFCK
jgi:hypothetical protein